MTALFALVGVLAFSALWLLLEKLADSEFLAAGKSHSAARLKRTAIAQPVKSEIAPHGKRL